MAHDNSENYERQATEADLIEWYAEKPLGLWVCAYKHVGGSPTFIRTNNPQTAADWALERSAASISGTEPPLEWICVTRMGEE